jgi:hypothetical protein
MPRIGDLVVTIDVDVRPFVQALKRFELQLWDVLYAEAYNRATVRVVTAR